MGTKTVKHDLYLDGVALEALVHFWGLDKVPDVCHSVWMGTCETDRNATVLHANTAEKHLAHVTLCRGGCIDCE